MKPRILLAPFSILIASTYLTAATLTLVGPGVNNGSFESDDGSGASSPDAQFANWTTGLNVTSNQRLDDNPSAGVWSAVVGGETGSGAKLGVLMNTGYAVAAGDSFSLSFDWADAFNWDDNSDSIDWRLFTTADNTATEALVTQIASGTNTFDSNTTNLSYQSEVFSAIGALTQASLGQELWIEFYSASVGAGEFARLDNVVLTVETDQEPTPAELASAMLYAWYPGEGNAFDYSEAMRDGSWLAGEVYASGRLGNQGMRGTGK